MAVRNGGSGDTAIPNVIPWVKQTFVRIEGTADEDWDRRRCSQRAAPDPGSVLARAVGTLERDPLRTKLSADVQISRWVRPEPSAAPWRQRHHQNEQNLLTNSHTVQVKCAPPCRWTKSASTEKTRRGARPGADA